MSVSLPRPPTSVFGLRSICGVGVGYVMPGIETKSSPPYWRSFPAAPMSVSAPRPPMMVLLSSGVVRHGLEHVLPGHRARHRTDRHGRGRVRDRETPRGRIRGANHDLIAAGGGAGERAEVLAGGQIEPYRSLAAGGPNEEPVRDLDVIRARARPEHELALHGAGHGVEFERGPVEAVERVGE